MTICANQALARPAPPHLPDRSTTLPRALVTTLLLVLLTLVRPVAAQGPASGVQSATTRPVTTSVTAPPTPAAAAGEVVAHGLFTGVQLHRPAGAVRQFVFLLANDGAPGAAEREALRSLVQAGALVAVVPLAPFYRRLEAQDGQCTYPGGAFENLSRHLQGYAKVPGYLLPIVVGHGPAAAFAYALVAQTPAGIFEAALSPGLCPALALKTPLCADNALRWRAGPARGAPYELLPAGALPVPWTALATPPVAAAGAADVGKAAACTPAQAQAFVASVPKAYWVGAEPAAAGSAFDAAYAKLAVRQAAPPPPPAQLADLPLIEPPTPGPGKRFAVLLSGDGGWAAIDKGLAAALLAQNVPVVGLDSLRYFWSARTPDGLAADLDRVIRHYAARWKRPEVILIGFSQGADVLPFAINRLPPATRASVRLSALLGLGQKASFEFHLANWIGPSGDKPIAPEARRLAAAETLCIYGSEERDSLCPQLAPLHVRALTLPGGHHFGGDYAAIAGKILEAVPGR